MFCVFSALVLLSSLERTTVHCDIQYLSSFIEIKSISIYIGASSIEKQFVADLCNHPMAHDVFWIKCFV